MIRIKKCRSCMFCWCNKEDPRDGEPLRPTLHTIPRSSTQVHQIQDNEIKLLLRWWIVLNSFNNTSRDEDNILEQLYQKRIFSDFYYNDFKFYTCSTIAQFYEILVLECRISLNVYFLQSLLEFKIWHNKDHLLAYIWSKMLSSSLYAILKLSKTISSQELFDYDCITL